MICCRNAAFSASRHVFDLKSETTTASSRWISAIIAADASRIRHRVKLDGDFGTHTHVAKRLGRPQSYVSKVESGERRLDVAEFVEIAVAVDADPVRMLKQAISATTKHTEP